MQRCNWFFRTALTVAVVIASVGSASAGWWHNGGGSSGGGSSGGSSGGWGGSSGGYGGSSGGWGSSGGYGRRGLFHHHHRGWGGGSSGGSSGGWGSSGGYGGGSSGGWGGGSSGGGSSGGWGGGGVIGNGSYYAPMDVVPGTEVPMGEVPAITPEAPMPGTEGAMLKANGTLIVEVPANAKIYVNDRLTKTPGEVREYISRNLVRGFNYTYEVRAEIEQDGKVVSETKKIDLRAGGREKLAFAFEPAAEVETSITVKVPANAKVNLGGNDTNASGETRVFRTSALKNGSEWKGYKIVVTAEVDGRSITKEQTFDVKAGDNKELSFDFDTASVADNR